LIAWLLLWLLISLWRVTVVTSPPYCDFALGLFVEANWLVDNDFDYWKLRHEEKAGNDGGPRVYMTSALPTLLALLMKTGLSTTGVMVVSHLITFAMAAALLVMVFAMLRPFVGRLAALLACAATMTTPLFGVQIEMIGLDLPMATLAVAAALAALRGRFTWAAILSTAAFLMKNTGLVATAALFAFLLVQVLVAPSDGRLAAWRRHRGGVVALTLALVAQTLIFRWGNTGERLTDRATMPFQYVNFSHVLGICPDLVLLTLIFLVVGLFAALFFIRSNWRREREKPLATRAWTLLRQALVARPLLLLAWLMVIALALAIALIVGFPVPRYFTLGVPFIYVIAAIMLFGWRPLRPLATGLSLAWIGLNVANAHGRFFPSIDRWQRNGPTLERSFEYRADHHAIIAAMREIEKSCRGQAIVTGQPFAFYLEYPRLGYVDQPLTGYVMNPYTGRRFANVSRLFVDHPRELVFVYVDNIYYGLSQITIGPPKPGDEVLYIDKAASPLVVYRRRLPDSAKTVQDVELWYLRNLWFDDSLDRRESLSLATRAAVLQAHGFPGQAVALLRLGIEARPGDTSSRLELARMLLTGGQTDEAMMHALEAAWLDPNSAEAYYLLGFGRAQQGDFVKAAAELQRALLLDPNHLSARFRLAQVRLQQGSANDAIEDLLLLLLREPDHLPARLQLAAAYLRQERYDEAISEIDKVLARDATLADAYVQRAEVRLKQGQPNDAFQDFAKALQLAPANVPALLGLGRLHLLGSDGQSQAAAAACFEKALSHHPRLLEAHVALAGALERLGRTDEAERHLREALRQSPQDAEVHNQLGMLLAKRNDWNQARRHFSLAVKLKPDHAAAAHNLQQAEAHFSDSP
jgi:Tfp pilus assembly protein PilF